MIIEEKIHHKIEGDNFLTIKSKVNQKKLAKLYGLLSNIYRNPKGAIVREYASNAYDANVEARNFATLSYNEIVAKYSWVKEPAFKMDEKAFMKLKGNLKRVSEKEPVIVGIVELDNQLYFYVKDYGIGLSPERMANIYFNYLDSTKEDTDDEIGGFGIGSKSALAYTHTFYIDTVYNGILYKYIMTKNVNGFPEGQLLYKSEYDESLENGTIIKLKIKEQGEEQVFFSEVNKQLSYMDNIYFDASYFTSPNYNGYDSKAPKEWNDFTLFKGNKWLKKSTKQPYNEMHLCLGKIAYTIDWTELGMSSINVPLALQFEIGELQPTPSRESILYTPESIKAIKNKIVEIQNLFIEKYKELFLETDDLGLFMERRDKTYSKIKIGEVEVDITNLLDYNTSTKLMSDSKIKFKPFVDAGFKTIPYNHNMINVEYKVDRKISPNTAKVIIQRYSNSFRFSTIKENSVLFGGKYILGNSDTPFNFHDNAYFLEKNKIFHDTMIILKKKEKDINYTYPLSLDSYSTDEEKEKIKSVFSREIKKYLESNGFDYNKFYPDPNWHHSYLAGNSRFSPKKKRVKLQGKIFTYKANKFAVNFSQRELDLEYISSFKGIVMFDRHSNKKELSDYYALLMQLRTLKGKNATSLNTGYLEDRALLVFTVSNANYKIIEEMENTKTPAQVFKEIRVFKRICTAMYIKKRFKKLTHLNNIYGCYDKLDLTYIALNRYIEDNYRVSMHFPGDYVLSQEFVNGMLKVALKHNMVDSQIVKDLEFLEDYNKDLTFVEILDKTNIPFENDKLLSLVELLKLKNKRVSNKYYLK